MGEYIVLLLLQLLLTTGIHVSKYCICKDFCIVRVYAQAQNNLQNNDNEEDGGRNITNIAFITILLTDYIVWIAVGVGAGLSIVFLVCGIIFCCFIGRR